MPDSDADSLFHCRQCGHCCEGRGGIVLGPSDLERLATFLELAPETVVEHYGEMSNGKLKIRSGNDGRCIFFREGMGCTVHEGKPSICRAWPFFRGNIEDPVSLALAKDFCPGIDPETKYPDFARAGRAYLAEQGLLAGDPHREANALILP